MLIALVGVSGSGKTTLMSNSIKRLDNIKRIPAVTTRPKRLGEIDGVDKYFLTDEEFEQQVKLNKLCFVDSFYNYRYAFRQSDFNCVNNLICEVYHKNIIDIKKYYNNTLCVYIKPYSLHASISAILDRKIGKHENEVRIKKLHQDKIEIEKLRDKGYIDFEFINYYDEKSTIEFANLIKSII